jgi:hypothetical protein
MKVMIVQFISCSGACHACRSKPCERGLEPTESEPELEGER